MTEEKTTIQENKNQNRLIDKYIMFNLLEATILESGYISKSPIKPLK